MISKTAKKFFTLFALSSVIGLSVSAQPAVKTETPATTIKVGNLNILPLSEIKEGMRGTAKTVFRGNVPEEFNVEILGIVPGAIGPKQDMIVGRISGGSAERTSVFAGMSGSPVYIDGKLVGAISYSFPFSKEPICGITPIEQMITIFEKKQSAAPASAPRAVSFAEIASIEPKFDLPKGATVSSSILAGGNMNSPVGTVMGQTFQPIATPLSFSGFSQETLNMFAPQLMSAELMPVAAAGGAAKMTPLEKYGDKTLQGGTSVSMQLTRGDYSMAAAGTVTFRDGEKVYAFGHPFLSLGTSDLPMSESHVVTVIPNLNNSFKLAVPDAMVGTMTQDRATGVYGNLGQVPKMIPVKLDFETSRGQTETYNYEVAKDEFLTPILLNMTLYNSIVANERGIGGATISVNGEITVKGQDSIKIERRFTGATASQFASGAVAIPVNMLLRSGFEDIEITGANLKIVSADGVRQAVLERIALDRTEIRPGETFEVQAFVRTSNGQTLVQRVPVTIPKDTPTGSLLVAVGDGNSLQQASATRSFIPKSAAELIKTINETKKSDRLYVQTFRVTNGAVIGAKELPNLPPSMLATLNNDRTAGGFTPTVLTALTTQEIPPADFLINGQQVLTLEVVK